MKAQAMGGPKNAGMSVQALTRESRPSKLCGGALTELTGRSISLCISWYVWARERRFRVEPEADTGYASSVIGCRSRQRLLDTASVARADENLSCSVSGARASAAA